MLSLLIFVPVGRRWIAAMFLTPCLLFVAFNRVIFGAHFFVGGHLRVAVDHVYNGRGPALGGDEFEGDRPLRHAPDAPVGIPRSGVSHCIASH